MKKIVLAIVFIMFTSAFAIAVHAQNSLKGIKSYLCYYEGAFPSTSIPSYDLYILDSNNHPPIAPLKRKGAKVVGYVTFGEIYKDSPFFQLFKKTGFLVDENKNWPGDFRVDIRKKEWHDFIIRDLVPLTVKQGFDGIFIDTIDTAWYLEHDKKMKGAVEAAIKLIKGVRKAHPNITIVLNNGLFLLKDVGNDIDALLVEDVYTLYDFKKKSYNMSTSDWTKEKLIPIKAFQRTFKKPVLALEYLKSSDANGIKEVARRAKADGLIPYISNIHLTTIFFHP